MKLTAFTQIIVTLAVTAWVFILPVEAVATILVLELALLLYIKHDKMTMAAIGGLAVFTGMMILLQLLFGSPLDVSLIGGLRMLVMTMAFLCLLAASRIQDIAKALVDRFHMPCEYAFMLTTALRFVPNFLTDSGITLDAQSCRGYSNRGNMFKRFFGCYSSVGYACGSQIGNTGAFYGAEGLWRQHIQEYAAGTAALRRYFRTSFGSSAEYLSAVD